MKVGDLVQTSRDAWHSRTATVVRLDPLHAHEPARVIVNTTQAAGEGLGPYWGHLPLEVIGNVGDEEAKLAAYINSHDGSVPPGY